MTANLRNVSLGLCCVFVTFPLAVMRAPADQQRNTATMSFGKGAWERAAWKLVRLANQPAPRDFFQFPDAIGSTGTTFSEKDYGSEADNAILVHDLGTAEAQVDVLFTIGRGFNGASAPGLCVVPRIKDGLVESSIAVFVADYAMAIWYQDVGPGGKSVRYRHLAQLARWSDPAKSHRLRCRISKKQASVAFQVDDSDVTVLSFVGDLRLSFVSQEINSLIGLWACHGECKFHEMKVQLPGTLPFLVKKNRNRADK